MYFVEKTKGTNYIKQFDYVIFITVLLLSMIGLAVLASAIQDNSEWKLAWFKQLVCLLIGIIIAIVASTIDYKDFKTLGILLYMLSIALLVMVLLFGISKHGSKSWLAMPVLGQFQPSEIAKVAFVLVVPVFFERIKEGIQVRKNLLKLIFYAGAPVLLVLRQPDIGTTCVFVFAFLVMIFIYGIPYRYFLISIGTAVAASPLVWFFILPKYPHIKHRIITYLNPELDITDKGWQVSISKMTIGSGQLFGKGLFHGLQTQNSNSLFRMEKAEVPFKQNDFIFTVVGEELGFIGSALVVILVIILLSRCLYIAMNARDKYGSFVVVGIAAIFAFHYIENIGMCVGVLPVTGIPLPFMSQGGTNLIANYMSVGILLSVSMRRKRTIFNASQ